MLSSRRLAARALAVACCAALWSSLIMSSAAFAQTPLGSGFTYQGVLKSGGGPFTGTADFRFILYNAAAAGAQVGVSQSVPGVTVTNGLFAATLDFGVASFNGEERWMSIEVRTPAGGGAYTLLSPRQRIAPTPYALRSLNAAISGTQPNAVSFTNAANAFTGSGAGLSNLSATSLSGTIPSGNIGGTYANGVNFNNVANSFTGSGAGLTNLDAGNIQTGNLSSARLPISGNWFLGGSFSMASNLLVVNPALDVVSVGAPPSSTNRLYVASSVAATTIIRAENTAGVGVGAGSGVVGQTRQSGGAGVMGTNLNLNGTGVIGGGNNEGIETLSNGGGGALRGLTTGLFAKSTTVGVGQAIYTEQASDIVRVGYWNGASFFKINGAGTVSTIVRDPQDRKVTMFCPESPEVLLTDYGQARLIDGFAHIELDPTFALNVTINDNHPLRVFIQLEDNEHCQGVVVKNKTATGFDVMELRGGRSNTPFQYQVTCNRADEVLDSGRVSQYADVRFPLAPGPEPKVQPLADR